MIQYSVWQMRMSYNINQSTDCMLFDAISRNFMALKSQNISSTNWAFIHILLDKWSIILFYFTPRWKEINFLIPFLASYKKRWSGLSHEKKKLKASEKKIHEVYEIFIDFFTDFGQFETIQFTHTTAIFSDFWPNSYFKS